MSAKVRVVLAEMEGSDETVLGAIRSFIGIAAPESPARESILAPQLPAPAFDPPALSASAEESTPEPVRSRAPKRAGVAKRQKSAASASPAPAATESATVVAVLQVLAKGPRTSGEVVTASGYSSGSVYPALKRLRDEGRVEMIEDPNDGQRKNRLKQ